MIEKRRRIVVDTNVFVSSALYPNSPPGHALASALASGIVLTSTEAWQELREVIERPKFNKVIPLQFRREYLASCLLFLKFVDIPCKTPHFSECRDPKDRKFLELALSGSADFIITGDDDLLSLHPWRGIAILSPADYLAIFE